MNKTTASARRQSAETAHFAAQLDRIERKIDSLKAQTTLSQKEYLTTLEACQYLGCTRALIWTLVQQGRLTKLKLDNGRTYYRQDELKAYIERGNEPEQEPATQTAGSHA